MCNDICGGTRGDEFTSESAVVGARTCGSNWAAGGCKAANSPGPALALYAKDGGPAFQKSPGVYDPLVVGAFFRSHPGVLPSFVDHGVCSLKTDPASPEAMPNGVICQEAMVVSMEISMKKYTESNR